MLTPLYEVHVCWYSTGMCQGQALARCIINMHEEIMYVCQSNKVKIMSNIMFHSRQKPNVERISRNSTPLKWDRSCICTLSTLTSTQVKRQFKAPNNIDITIVCSTHRFQSKCQLASKLISSESETIIWISAPIKFFYESRFQNILNPSWDHFAVNFQITPRRTYKCESKNIRTEKSTKTDTTSAIASIVIWGLYYRVGPYSYKWSYNPYQWPCKWATGVLTPMSGVKKPYTYNL